MWQAVRRGRSFSLCKLPGWQPGAECLGYYCFQRHYTRPLPPSLHHRLDQHDGLSSRRSYSDNQQCGCHGREQNRIRDWFDQYSTTILYSTYLGGNVYDVGNGVATDLALNTWVIGSTSSTTFPVVNPLKATNTDTWANQTVAFVAELAPGPVPAVSLSAPALSFPGGFLKVTSAKQSVTLTNLGNDVLNISGMVATGDFALVTTGTSCPYLGGTLAPLANCSIDVTFTPTATGARTGTVAIADNAGGSPQAVQLTGTGDVTVALTVSPTSLSFGNQLLGTPAPRRG